MWADSLSSMTYVSGTLSVDTFFVVGGTLVVYTFLKARKSGVKFNIFQFYIHRYLRLTPPLAAAVLVSATLLEYMGSGPRWSNVKVALQEPCAENWWSTVLYVQTYVKKSAVCLGQTWYLDVDMQLYVLSPIILIPLANHAKIGIGILAVSILATIVGPFYIAYDKELSGILTNLHGMSNDYMQYYYQKTHTRAAPWLMGALLGYILARIKFEKKLFNLKFNKIVVAATWMLCTIVMLTCVYCGHSTLREPEYDRIGNTFYIALVRPIWALCIMWIIFACVMGCGGPVNWFLSLPIYQVLNRFSYSIYIVHLSILFMMGYASNRGLYFSTFNAAYSFWGIYMLSYCLSFFWIMAFESPVIIIEKFIFNSKPKLTKKTAINQNGSSGANEFLP